MPSELTIDVLPEGHEDDDSDTSEHAPTTLLYDPTDETFDRESDVIQDPNTDPDTSDPPQRRVLDTLLWRPSCSVPPLSTMSFPSRT